MKKNNQRLIRFIDSIKYPKCKPAELYTRFCTDFVVNDLLAESFVMTAQQLGFIENMDKVKKEIPDRKDQFNVLFGSIFKFMNLKSVQREDGSEVVLLYALQEEFLL